MLIELIGNRMNYPTITENKYFIHKVAKAGVPGAITFRGLQVIQYNQTLRSIFDKSYLPAST